MKAGVIKEFGHIEMDEYPRPKPGPDEVLLKVAYCGLCGTDPEIVEGRFGRFQPPMVIGHECSGTIAELGSNVTGYEVGQRVACNFRSYCGGCYYCRNKMEHYCENSSGTSGGYAEYATFHKTALYKLPDDMSLEIGAFLEPVSVAVHAVDLANIHPGNSVAILGAGAIGQLILQIAIRAGAIRTLVSEPVAEKRELARRMGADVVVDPRSDNLEEAGKKLTGGRGFDTVIDASGNLGAAKQAIFMADKCGTVLWAAVYPRDSEIGVPPAYMYSNELTIRSVFVSPYSFPRALALLPKLELKPLLSEIVPLKDIDRAFEIHKEGKAVKILVKP